MSIDEKENLETETVDFKNEAAEVDSEDNAINQQDDTNEVELLQRKIEELEADLAKQKEGNLRNLAELENFKKRKQQEVESFKEYATEKILLEVLPIVDSFDLAIAHSKNEEAHPKEVIEGFLLIRKQLQTFLEKNNIEAIDSINKEFDPNLHQAISQEDVDGVDSDTVIKEVQKGYRLKSKVIRPSMVVVST